METKIKMLALLPCGLRNAFKVAMQNKFPYIKEENGFIIDGNLNYEKEFYNRIDVQGGIDELPDIFISSDINSIYHPYFLKEYLNTQYYEETNTIPSDFFEKVGYTHPDKVMTMLPGNLLVIVANTAKYTKETLPHSWYDLFKPGQHLVLRGDEDFFCNALFLPLVRDYGYEAITSLAKNTLSGSHPANMVKLINAGHAEDVSAFVMPYTFYLRIRHLGPFQLVWPAEGAILSPVQMLIRKGCYKKYKDIVDYITEKDFSKSLFPIGFFPVNKDCYVPLPGNVNWIGWDYIYKHDMKTIKDKAQKIFFQSYANDAFT